MSTPPSHESAAAAPTSAKSSGGLVRALLVAACISAIVVAQCVAAYLLLPSASDLSAAEEHKLAELAKEAAERHGDQEQDEEEVDATDEKPQTEVDLGAFRISTHRQGASGTLRIDFRLVGMVESADRTQFESLYELHRNRIRDRIIFEIRSAEIADLSDPGLGLIKRRILERVNAQLGRPLLQGVVVSDFAFVGV